MNDVTKPVPEEAAIGISLNIPLENAQPGVQIRHLTVQTHLPQSMGEGPLNALLDKLIRVTERQYKIREIDVLIEERRVRRLALDAVRKSYNEQLAEAQERWSQAGQRSGFKAVGKEKADFTNKEREIERLGEIDAELNERIQKLKDEVNYNAAASPADRRESPPDR
jgi:hypothetical protein